MLAGTVVALAALGVLSELKLPPGLSSRAPEPTMVAAAPAPGAAPAEAAASLPKPEPAPAVSAAPKTEAATSAPTPAAQPAVPQTDTTVMAAPVAGQAPEAAPAPTAGGTPPVVASASEPGVSVSAGAVPAAPAAEAAPAAMSDAARPPAPAAGLASAPPTAKAAPSADAPPAAIPGAAATKVDLQPAQVAMAPKPDAPAPAGEAPATAPALPTVLAPPATAAPATGKPEPAPAPAASAPPAILVPGQPGPGTGEGKPKMLTEVRPLPEVGLQMNSGAGFGNAVPGVTVGRLPRIGDPEPAKNDKLAANDAPAAGEQGGTPAYKRNGEPMLDGSGRPKVVVILIDSGAAGLDRKALAAMTVPVTFALDPTVANAAADAQVYRDAHREVVLLAAQLPPNPSPKDMEVAFQSYFSLVGSAVAVLDQEDGGFQNNRLVSQQVASILGADGYGLVTYDRGLNAADQLARRDGVASARIYRSLDDHGENADAIRRTLDRAAFKAAQDGSVVVIGHAVPETIAALRDWAQSPRGAQVAFVPLTALFGK